MEALQGEVREEEVDLVTDTSAKIVKYQQQIQCQFKGIFECCDEGVTVQQHLRRSRGEMENIEKEVSCLGNEFLKHMGVCVVMKEPQCVLQNLSTC